MIMKIKTIRFKKTVELSTEQEKEVKNMIIIIALFMAGMIVGSGIIRQGSASELISDFSSIFNLYIDDRNNQKAYEIFINVFGVNFLFFISTFCTGLSCIGTIMIPLIPVVKGIGYGMLSGYLFSTYSITGMGYYLLTIFPAGIFGATALLSECCTAWIMSKEILLIILSKKQPQGSVATAYLKRFAIYLCLNLAAAAIETILVKAFSYMFIF